MLQLLPSFLIQIERKQLDLGTWLKSKKAACSSLQSRALYLICCWESVSIYWHTLHLNLVNKRSVMALFSPGWRDESRTFHPLKCTTSSNGTDFVLKGDNEIGNSFFGQQKEEWAFFPSYFNRILSKFCCYIAKLKHLSKILFCLTHTFILELD